MMPEQSLGNSSSSSSSSSDAGSYKTVVSCLRDAESEEDVRYADQSTDLPGTYGLPSRSAKRSRSGRRGSRTASTFTRPQDARHTKRPPQASQTAPLRAGGRGATGSSGADIAAKASKDETSHAGATDPGQQEQRPESDGVSRGRGEAGMSLSALSLGEGGFRTGTHAEKSVEEENWELDISPGNPGYAPSGHLYFQGARHKSRRIRKQMYKQQTEEYKRRQAEHLMIATARETAEGDKRQETAEEDSERPRPRMALSPRTNFVPVPVEEIEARTAWRNDYPRFDRADAALGTDYPICDVQAQAGNAQAQGSSFARGGWPTSAPQGTLICVPYETRIDTATNVLMPAQPAPGHQFVVMQVPAMRMHGPGAGGEGLVPPYAVPAPGAFLQGPGGEQIHYLPVAAGPSWRQPSADMAYVQPPATSDQAPLFWIPNAPPPFVHTGMAPLEEQLAPEEQAAAQQFEDAGVYAEGGALCDDPLENCAIMAEQLREHTFSKSGVSKPPDPPPEATVAGWQSAVPPEPASNDQHVPPPRPAATAAAQPAQRAPEVRAVPKFAEEDTVAAFLLSEWTKVERAGQANYYDPAKARSGRRGV